MNRTIYKYLLGHLTHQELQLPPLSKPLSVGLDPAGEICLWAVVHQLSALRVSWDVWILGTGNPFPDEVTPEMFLGSVTKGPFVWHIFINRKENK